MFDFEEELKKLPHVPGVYLMHDSGDHIIYVGKAIDLYNRVHQYFQAGYKKSPKIQKMYPILHGLNILSAVQRSRLSF